MDHKERYIEIPFGAKDSELVETTYFIPEGMEAVIEGDKVIIRRKESEDEKIRGAIIDHLKDNNLTEWAAWLEKQKQQEKDILEDAILDGNEDGLIAETIRYKNEKKSEQKLDKVKPKFGVGDRVRYKA